MNAELTAKLDAICKRQTARFIEHLHETGQHSDRIQAAYQRSMRFVFQDVKTATGCFTENADANHK